MKGRDFKMIEILINGKLYKVTSGVKNQLDMEKVHVFYADIGDTVRKIKDGEYRIYFNSIPRYITLEDMEKFRKNSILEESGSEGIVPGKRVNGHFVPDYTPEYPRTTPARGSLLSELLCGKKPKEALAEVKGYEDLTRILDEALQQATSGKGKERHAGGKPFDKQPIMEIARMTGLAYQTGQAMKKIQESHTLLEIKGKEAAINELRGAIIYLAAAIKTIEES